jgi:hypothetical protein
MASPGSGDCGHPAPPSPSHRVLPAGPAPPHRARHCRGTTTHLGCDGAPRACPGGGLHRQRRRASGPLRWPPALLPHGAASSRRPAPAAVLHETLALRPGRVAALAGPVGSRGRGCPSPHGHCCRLELAWFPLRTGILIYLFISAGG